MAPDNAGKQAKNADTQETKSKARWRPWLIVAALMLLEGAAIYAAMSLVSPEPKSAVAEEDEEAIEDALRLDQNHEVALCDVTAFNRKEGRLYVYQMEITTLVAKEDVDTISRFVEARTNSIKDRVQTVIRAADPKDLNDPTLEVIKRQLLFEINNLLGGKELLKEILIPKMLQSRANL